MDKYRRENTKRITSGNAFGAWHTIEQTQRVGILFFHFCLSLAWFCCRCQHIWCFCRTHIFKMRIYAHRRCLENGILHNVYVVRSKRKRFASPAFRPLCHRYPTQKQKQRTLLTKKTSAIKMYSRKSDVKCTDTDTFMWRHTEKKWGRDKNEINHFIEFIHFTSFHSKMNMQQHCLAYIIMYVHILCDLCFFHFSHSTSQFD